MSDCGCGGGNLGCVTNGQHNQKILFITAMAVISLGLKMPNYMKAGIAVVTSLIVAKLGYLENIRIPNFISSIFIKEDDLEFKAEKLKPVTKNYKDTVDLIKYAYSKCIEEKFLDKIQLCHLKKIFSNNNISIVNENCFSFIDTETVKGLVLNVDFGDIAMGDIIFNEKWVDCCGE